MFLRLYYIVYFKLLFPKKGQLYDDLYDDLIVYFIVQIYLESKQSLIFIIRFGLLNYKEWAMGNTWTNIYIPFSTFVYFINYMVINVSLLPGRASAQFCPVNPGLQTESPAVLGLITLTLSPGR